MASKASRMSINHAAGIFADMSVDGPAIGTLVAVIDRAKNLPNRKTMGKQNPYCAARLGKEAKKTETDLRGGQTPKWDQELRFTVHESPDYFRLKVTVFNDDKRTDLIGETWVDLKDLIIPGGSQSDQWHPLQYRGRYAGDVRIEMTYYDTRPEDEAVIERRTQAAEKIHGKSAPSAATSSSISSNSAAATPTHVGSSSLSGPRQLKDVKRRPLPTDPTGSAPSRPSPPEKVPSAPVPLPAQVTPPRPMHEQPHAHSYSTPPTEYMRHAAPRQSMAPDPVYDSAPIPVQAPPASRPMRTYETPDDFHREWSHPSAPPLQQAPPKRHPQEAQYAGYRDAYDSRSYARPRSGYGNPPPVDYRSSRQEIPVSRPEQFPEMHASVAEPPRPSSHHSNYAFPTEQPQHYVPNGDMMVVHGAPPARYTSRSSGASMHDHGAVEYVPAAVPNGMALEPVDHYRGRGRSRSQSNSLVHDGGSNAMRHAEYATMQPRVEDEDDDGPPPPPPVHRSGVAQMHSSPNHANNHVQQLVPSPTPSYQAYSPEYAPSPRNSFDLNNQHQHHLPADVAARIQDHLPPPTNTPSMPPSLVAGFDPAIADAESDRAASERVAVRRRSAIFDNDDPICPPSRDPSPGPAMMPPYPVEGPASSAPHLPLSAPVDNPHQALVTTRRSFHSDSRIVPRRKSVSPHPAVSPHPSPLPPAGTMPVDHPAAVAPPVSQIPFSPDSYDQFNPNAARAAVTRDLAPAYDTPSEAMHAARRSEAEAARPGNDSGPIIGDDGREIDPSDHLPTDTWAPEPERKKKTGVVVRFKKSPASAARTSPRPATAVTVRPQLPPSQSSPSQPRPTSSYGVADVNMNMSRGRSGYAPAAPVPVAHTYGHGHGPGPGPGHARTYSTPSPRSVRSRNSVSPAPSGHSGSHSPSSFYSPTHHGPPIPAKVPIAQPMPVSRGRVVVPTGGGAPPPGMDALSRELGTIDIGSVGCTTGRAMRRYVPRVQTGYAM